MLTEITAQQTEHDNTIELDSVRGTVHVFSVDKSDALRVNRLLQRFGFVANWFSSISEYQERNLPQSNKLVKPVASIVFYRRHINHVREFLSLKSLQGKKIIVVSDCALESTVVTSLANGAHHYFYSHESFTLLQARLEAALRNQIRLAKRSLKFEDMYFDVSTRRVKITDVWVELSPKEYDLAEYMFSNPGRLVTNAELITSVWSLPIGVDTRRIDTAACRLRKKLQLRGSSSWELKKVRLVGYRLVPSKSTSAHVLASNEWPSTQLQVAI